MSYTHTHTHTHLLLLMINTSLSHSSSYFMTATLMQDSLIQTVRQVQAAFEALLDILELQSQLDADTQAAAADNQSFLHSIAATLLAIGELQQKFHTLQTK